MSFVFILDIGAISVYPATGKEVQPMPIDVTSSAFKNGQPIPKKYTGDDVNVSPNLTWSHAPQGTKSIALIMEDPDAPMGTFIHWVIYNLPPTETGLGENIAKSPNLANGARQGTNSFRQSGYAGPKPPPGKPHHYYFKVYALDSMLNDQPGLSSDQLHSLMTNHILGEGQLMGTYSR